MEIKFADTFWDSLSKLIKRERWYWKAWDFIRYDLPEFFYNVWVFRKALWNYRWFDWTYSMEMLNVSVKQMEKNYKNGYEENTSHNKKVYKMRRAILIMDHFTNDDFIELAEKELGKLSDWDLFGEDSRTPEQVEHDSNVFARAREMESQMWKELWTIFEGQDYTKFEKGNLKLSSDESYDIWVKQFDGTGLRGWWH